MKKARDIMTPNPECVGEKETMIDAAKKMLRLNTGVLPICGEDNRLKGMLTDRDIVVKVLAEGKDPAKTTAGELGQGKPVTIGADDSIDEALRTMIDHKVRRLPVIDGHDLVGIVSQADVATKASRKNNLYTYVARPYIFRGKANEKRTTYSCLLPNLENPKVGDLVESISAAP